MEPVATLKAPAWTKPDLALLQQALATACRHADADTRRKEILQLLIALTNAAAGAYFLRDESGDLQAAAGITTDRIGAATEEVRDDLRRAAFSAFARQRLVKLEQAKAGSATILASPIQGDKAPIGAISLLLFLGTTPAETFATVLQLTVSLAAELELGDSRSPPVELNTAVGLLAAVRASADVDSACLAVAETLAAVSGAIQVAVVLTSPGKKRSPQLKALSGVTEFDGRSDIVRTLERAFSATPDMAGWRRWPGGSEQSDTELRGAAEQMHAREIWAAPIASTGGGLIGGMAFLFSDLVRNGDTLRANIEPVIATVADTLNVFRRGSVANTRGQSRLDRKAKALIGLTLMIAIAGLSVLPADHRIKARSLLEPEVRRFVVAPFDGVLETSRFKPGDSVEQGDILATLDGRELDLELVSLQAQRDKLSKQRDVTLAAGETAATQITELELARIGAELGLLEYKSNHLQLRSPIRGVVTQGDLSREEGSPVTTGQRLFELAPLDRMVAEVEVPAQDVAYFLEGAPAELTLEAFPKETLEGPVTGLHPRATIRDGRNVYLAEIELDNPDLRLRPGMRGEVRITVGRHSLAWVLFHRAWEKGIQWLR